MLLVLTSLSGLALGCEDEDEELRNLPTKQAQERLVEGIRPVEPRVRFRRALGEPLPAEGGDFYYDHRGTPLEEESDRIQAEVAANVAQSGWAVEVDEEKTTRVIYAGPGAEYELEFDNAELAVLGAIARERGLHHASTPLEEEASAGTTDSPPLRKPQGWSNGVDSRAHKDISGPYPSNQRELKRIGRFNGNCTGIAVGRRLILTAAHCVLTDGLNYQTHTYSARRSNASLPYGTMESEGYQVANEWVNLSCHITRGPNCHQHDWAIVILKDDAWAGQTHPGWMGYSVPDWGHFTFNDDLYENGYPNHTTCYAGQTALETGAPSYMFSSTGSVLTSRTHVAYGQNIGGTVRDFQFFVGDYPRLVHFSNDISCGHSGGAIWSDQPGTNGPYVLGINAYERCAGDACGAASGTVRTHPSGARAMTPGLADLIASYRVSHP